MASSKGMGNHIRTKIESGPYQVERDEREKNRKPKSRSEFMCFESRSTRVTNKATKIATAGEPDRTDDTPCQTLKKGNNTLEIGTQEREVKMRTKGENSMADDYPPPFQRAYITKTVSPIQPHE